MITVKEVIHKSDNKDYPLLIVFVERKSYFVLKQLDEYLSFNFSAFMHKSKNFQKGRDYFLLTRGNLVDFKKELVSNGYKFSISPTVASYAIVPFDRIDYFSKTLTPQRSDEFVSVITQFKELVG